MKYFNIIFAIISKHCNSGAEDVAVELNIFLLPPCVVGDHKIFFKIKRGTPVCMCKPNTDFSNCTAIYLNFYLDGKILILFLLYLKKLSKLHRSELLL